MISDAEEELARQLAAAGLPEPVRQYRYARPRLLRADFAWPRRRLLVEVVGGVYTRQAHGSISGVLADIERVNEASLRGYRMLRFTPQQVESGEALKLICQALEGRSR